MLLGYRAFPTGLVAFVLTQVALVAGGLTLVRAWRAAPAGGPRGPRLLLVLRGGLVVVRCAVGTVTYGIADALTTSAGSDGTLTAWLGLAVLTLGAAATAATLSRSWRGARVAGIASVAGSREDSDALADLRAVGVLTLVRLQRRVPMLDAIVGRAAALVPMLSADPKRRTPLARRAARCRADRHDRGTRRTAGLRRARTLPQHPFAPRERLRSLRPGGGFKPAPERVATDHRDLTVGPDPIPSVQLTNEP
jgi:hypothetical protein